MAKTNVPRKNIHTHEGAIAKHINPEAQLRRSVMACLLWESQFYESGVMIADRIKSLVPQVDANKVAAMAVDARIDMKLRHVPLLLVREMARYDSHKGLVAATLSRVIRRADELAEFVSIYWKDGRQPLSAQAKKGLASAFIKFDAYQLAKYNQKGAVKLRDVLRLCHAKPKDADQDTVWKKLINGTLEPPDTWEVGLSSGADKKATWTRLLSEGKMGAMAVLRNLRNFKRDGVDNSLIVKALDTMNVSKVLPFRFLTAARHAMDFEPDVERAFFRCCEESQTRLTGKTILIVDVSGSMYYAKLSEKSELTRVEAAESLAVLIREQCAAPVIYATAGNDYTRVHATEQVPARRGFALADAVHKMTRPLGGGGIFLKQVMDYVFKKEKSADRIIVITDEQDCGVGSADSPLKANAFGKHNYLINVASYKNGIGYDKWVHIDGWSEAVLKYIAAYETASQ